MPAKTLTKADIRRIESKLDRIDRRLENPDLSSREFDRLKQRIVVIREEIDHVMKSVTSAS